MHTIDVNSFRQKFIEARNKYTHVSIATFWGSVRLHTCINWARWILVSHSIANREKATKLSACVGVRLCACLTVLYSILCSNFSSFWWWLKNKGPHFSWAREGKLLTTTKTMMMTMLLLLSSNRFAKFGAFVLFWSLVTMPYSTFKLCCCFFLFFLCCLILFTLLLSCSSFSFLFRIFCFFGSIHVFFFLRLKITTEDKETMHTQTHTRAPKKIAALSF